MGLFFKECIWPGDNKNINLYLRRTLVRSEQQATRQGGTRQRVKHSIFIVHY